MSALERPPAESASLSLMSNSPAASARRWKNILETSNNSSLRNPDTVTLTCLNCSHANQVEPRYCQRAPLPILCLGFLTLQHTHDQPLLQGPALKFTCSACGIERSDFHLDVHELRPDGSIHAAYPKNVPLEAVNRELNWYICEHC